ncbi:MAG: flagellar hook-basal body complex protein, partial [Pseudomonadota bacterium]|nr:flagellar hook-basal body complex protein [Pseudomonadota bacterium]
FGERKMTMFSSLSAAFSGMRSHSDAMRSISDNIVNVQTPGYKTADTRFKEMISEIGRTQNRIIQEHMGVAPETQFFIDKQGTTEFTGRALDVAIQGKGFFVSNTEADGSGSIELTRNGQLLNKSVNIGGTDQLFLSDVKGNVVLGWPTDETGSFQIGADVGSLEPIRIDSNAFSITAQASTEALLQVNLKNDAVTGESFNVDLAVFDEIGTDHNIKFNFAKTATLNTWDVTPSFTDGTTIAQTVPFTMTFDATGAVISPTSQTLDLTFSNTGGGTASVAVDFSTMSQFAGGFTLLDLSADGNANGLLDSVNFDETGAVIGNFSNGVSRNLYKLPIAIVDEPNKLDLRFNTHYAANSRSGEITLFEADQSGLGDFVAGSLEASTTDLATEFNNMIIAQQSFAMNGQSFRTIDAMAQIAYELKR